MQNMKLSLTETTWMDENAKPLIGCPFLLDEFKTRTSFSEFN